MTAPPSSGPSGPWTRAAYRSGELAALAGSPRTANPHPAGSAPARSWSDGWRARTPPRPAAERPARSPLRRQRDEADMTLLDKLPDMEDDALATLGANAERLAASGTPKQMKDAQAALPAIQAEIAVRKERKAAAAPPRKTPAPRKKTATKAAATKKAEAKAETA